MIDMHLHTKWSDGSLTVPNLVKKISNSNVDYAILTDHDCILGNDEFKSECDKYNISSSVGTELEAYYNIEQSIYLHMLCYNYKDSRKLNSFLENERKLRIESIKRAISIINDKGNNVTFEEVIGITEGRHLLINHLCILLEKYGIFNNRFDAYNYFLNGDVKKIINYPKPTVEEIIKLIYSVDGIPVLAHPKRIKMTNIEKDSYVKYLKSCGLIGIESYYSFDNECERNFSNYLAKKYELIETVGSDWHCEEDNIPFSNEHITHEKERVLKKVFFHE
jgi:predicted metal-dependent phosphoesterase TrpH